MKKYLLIAAGLLVIATCPSAIAQSDNSGFAEDSYGSSDAEKQWIRNEAETTEANLAEMPFDGFLSASGYIVYPIEENPAVLEARIAKNPMVLHKEFIPRRVLVLRRVNGRTSDASVKGTPGKQFMIVSEIGSASQFMVDLKDFHFVQTKDEALGNLK